jgi:hypothetical protein
MKAQQHTQQLEITMARQIKARAAAKPAAKATKTPTSNKAATKVASPAVVEKATVGASQTVVFKHWSVSPYAGLRTPFLGGLTAAALIVAGYATIKGNVMSKAKTAGRPAVLRALAGDFAGEWKRLGRIEGAALTVDGINALNARLLGEARTYNTNANVVEAMTQAMTKGGKVEAAGHPPVTFSAKVTL